AYVGGALGTIRGAAVATWIGTLVWWWQLHVAMRESGKMPEQSVHRSGGGAGYTRSRRRRRYIGLGRNMESPPPVRFGQREAAPLVASSQENRNAESGHASDIRSAAPRVGVPRPGQLSSEPAGLEQPGVDLP